MARYKEKYLNEVKKALKERFGYKNNHQIPRIEKVVINTGVGRAVQDAKVLDYIEDRIALITAQKPLRTKARKSIAGFKLREEMPIGVSVTLRGEKMYDFLDRLVNIAIPRIRDFRGIKAKAFDGKGNYSLGIKEHTVFPEISYEDQSQIFGIQINIITTAKSDEEAKALLEEFGFPFKKEVTNG